MVNKAKAISATRDWISNFVVQLNICPFAGHPFGKELIGYEVYNGTDIETGLVNVAKALQRLEETSTAELETTLIIFTDMLDDFSDYLDFLTMTEGLLIDLKLEGIIQIASFHPDYQFHGSAVNDHSNYTNRSPYPMIHMLREDSVHAATQRHPDVDAIPQRNIDLLQSMSVDEVKKYLK